MNMLMTRDIVTSYGPSGREAVVSKVIAGYIKDHCDKLYEDALGNLIAYKKGRSGKKVMLSAHMDQIGFAVLDVDDNGFLRVANVGGIGAYTSLGCAVVFENGQRGAIGKETEGVEAGKLSLGQVFIDIGAKSKEEALEKVSIGDMAVYDPNWMELNGRLCAGALDDRIGCAIVVEAFLAAPDTHDVYAVFTVQEEVGYRGAGVAAYAIEPDFAINFDVTGNGDTPKSSPLAVALGKGAAIKVMDRSVIVPPRAREFLKDCANEAGVAFQMEVLPYGGTDTSSIQRSRAGVVSSCISVPCRYVHSPVEMVDMQDVEGALKMTVAALGRENLPL